MVLEVISSSQDALQNGVQKHPNLGPGNRGIWGLNPVRMAVGTLQNTPNGQINPLKALKCKLTVCYRFSTPPDQMGVWCGMVCTRMVSHVLHYA